MKVPGKLVTNSGSKEIIDLVRWMNDLRDVVAAIHPKATPDISMKVASDGTSYFLQKKSNSGSGNSSSEARWG